MNRTRLVLFDMDGTVMDSMPILTDLAVECITYEFNYEAMFARQRYLNTVGRPFLEQLMMIFPAQDYTRHRRAAEHYDQIHNMIAPYLPMMESADYAMRELRDENIVSVLISSTAQRIIARMHRIFTLGFDEVVGYRENFTKHDQAVYAIGKYQPSQINYFGDTAYDGEIAEAIGAKFTLVTREPGMLISSVRRAIRGEPIVV